MNKVFLLLLFPVFAFCQSEFDKTEQLFQEKKYVIAEQIMFRFVAENPKNLKGIELLGDAFGYQKKWDKAIIEYRKLVKTKPEIANYHYKLGGALGMKALTISKLSALGIIGEIKRSFLKSAELDKNHIDARWALVELYMQLPGIIGGSTSKSLKYANQLEALSKVDGYLAKGYIYEYDDEPELAEKYYKLAINEGGSLTCFEKLSHLYESQNEPEKAIATIEKSYATHNRNALHYQIGKVSADYNIQLAKGERCLKRYIKNYSAKDGVPVEWAYFRLAQIYKNKQNKTEALKWINKALQTRADFSQAVEEKVKILGI